MLETQYNLSASKKTDFSAKIIQYEFKYIAITIGMCFQNTKWSKNKLRIQQHIYLRFKLIGLWSTFILEIVRETPVCDWVKKN